MGRGFGMNAEASGGRGGMGTIGGGLLAAVVITSLALAVWLATLGGRTALTGAVLLLIVALAAAGVLLGGEPYGPEVEGKLDLSARMGLGALGGLLGALLALVLDLLLEAAGVQALLGVPDLREVAAPVTALRLTGGAVWGMIFGTLLPGVPGRGVLARGAVFSLAPSLWMLLKVLPVDRGLGIFGVELGAFTFVFVLLFNLAWGIVTAWVLAWGERTDLAPLDSPLG